jgi:hypothetical protein
VIDRINRSVSKAPGEAKPDLHDLILTRRRATCFYVPPIAGGSRIGEIVRPLDHYLFGRPAREPSDKIIQFGLTDWGAHILWRTRHGIAR